MPNQGMWVRGPLAVAVLALASQPLDDLWATVFGSWEPAIAEVVWAVGNVPEDEVRPGRFGRELDLTVNEDGMAWGIVAVRAGVYAEVEVTTGRRDADLTVWEVVDSAVVDQHDGEQWGDHTGQRVRIHPAEEAYLLVRVRDRGAEEGAAVAVLAHDPSQEWRGTESATVDVLHAAWELRIDPESIERSTMGDPIEGFIAEGQAAWHLVDLPEGAVRVMLESDDFDTMLRVWEINGTELGQSYSDDDGWYEMNSYLRLPGTEPRRLLIQVRAFGQGRGGTYTLHVPDPTVVQGALERVMETLADALPFDPTEAEVAELGVRTQGVLPYGGQSWFIYDVGDATRVNIDLTSTAFDTVVDVWRVLEGARSLGSMSSNDDGGPGSDSRLSLTTAPGTVLLVKVRAFGNRNGGRFTLHVR